MILSSFQQGSPEWHAARCGVVTASNFKAVLTKGSGKTRANYMRKLAEEIITGRVAPPAFESEAMQRGVDLEPDARQAYDSCLAILDDLPEPDGGAIDQLSLRIIRANATAYLAGILRILGKQSESLAAFSDAIKQLRDLAAGQLEDDSIQFDLARCLTHYGSALRDYENNEQAVEVLSESLQMGEQILRRAPEDPHRISWQVFSLYAYALLDGKMERFEEGLEKLRSCERLLQTLIRDYPSVYDYQFKLAASLVQEIFFLYRLNDAAAAMTVWERFCHHLDSSVARFPNDLAFARWSSRWQYAWADELSERGRTDEAQWHWKQALRAGERLLTSEAMTDTERNEQFIEQARNIALAPSSTPEEKQRALSLARQATASSPNNRIARAALGIVLFENEQYEEARKELMVARGDQTGAGRLEQWYFAMTLWKLGFHSEARHHAHSITNDGEPGDLDRACINRVADRARKMISPGPSKNTNNQP